MNNLARTFVIAVLFWTAAVTMTLVAKADGRVTQPSVADPVTTWRIAELKFPLLHTKSAIVHVAYFRESGAVDHVAEHSFTGGDYDLFLGALSTSAGAGEGACIVDGVPDRGCIFNLRLSHWMVTNGKIEGVTAESLPGQ
jgi:hypothetical protein